jgi:hypothetical protein
MIIALVGAAYLLLQAGGGNVDTSATPQTVKIAHAIATAEGFFAGPNSRPARDHNPGNVTQDLIGKAVGMDGPFPVYATDADGWANLYAQVNLWLQGGSAHATADSTVAQIAGFYTTDVPAGAQANWAINFANDAGVTTDTPIGAIAA